VAKNAEDWKYGGRAHKTRHTLRIVLEFRRDTAAFCL
jgi:hypothetical protein